MIAYPWNPLWAKLHTLEERQQLFKLLEKEAMSAYHQIKTRPNTWLEALSAGILIVIALFEIGKYHTVRSRCRRLMTVEILMISISGSGLVLALGTASVSCNCPHLSSGYDLILPVLPAMAYNLDYIDKEPNRCTRARSEGRFILGLGICERQISDRMMGFCCSRMIHGALQTDE